MNIPDARPSDAELCTRLRKLVMCGHRPEQAAQRIEALAAEVADLHQTDRIKTREINVLVPENRQLAAEVERLREVLQWLDRRGGLGVDVHEHIAAALAAPKDGP
jgi:aminoglycoside phosphotransferase (APT) family kinase protein